MEETQVCTVLSKGMASRGCFSTYYWGCLHVWSVLLSYEIIAGDLDSVLMKTKHYRMCLVLTHVR